MSFGPPTDETLTRLIRRHLLELSPDRASDQEVADRVRRTKERAAQGIARGLSPQIAWDFAAVLVGFAP
jgi:hypothetical protein